MERCADAARAGGFASIPMPDISLVNAGSGNPMDRETRYAPCAVRTASDKEDMDGR